MQTTQGITRIVHRPWRSHGTTLQKCQSRTHPYYWFGREGLHFDVASAGKKRTMIIDLETMEDRVVEEA